MLVLAIVFCVSGAVIDQERNNWTMEFRIVANATEDATIVQLAKRTSEKTVYKSDELIAKWVPVMQSVEAVLGEEPKLVTRLNNEGRTELLVLINTNDVNESDVRKIYQDKDMNGRMVLRLLFNDEGSEKISNQTKNLFAYGKPKRHMAEIMDGKIYAIPLILSPVSVSAMITGDIDQALIDDIIKRSKPGFVTKVWDSSEIPRYAITVTPLRIIIFLIIFFLLIFGSLPTKGLKESNHPHSWIIVGIVAGIIICGYKFGFSRTYDTVDMVDGTSIFRNAVNISLLWVFVGGAIGTGLGFLAGWLSRFFVRRAIHNVVRLIFRRSQQRTPSGVQDWK